MLSNLLLPRIVSSISFSILRWFGGAVGSVGPAGVGGALLETFAFPNGPLFAKKLNEKGKIKIIQFFPTLHLPIESLQQIQS